MMVPVKYFEMIEVVKPATTVSAGSKLPLGNQPQLRNVDNRRVRIVGIEAYNDTALPKSPNNVAVCNAAAFKNALLVLKQKGTEKLQLLPLTRLNVLHVEANAVPFTDVSIPFADLVEVDWALSYFQFCDAPAASEFAYLLGVWYELL
jgi:hypothetical protein